MNFRLAEFILRELQAQDSSLDIVNKQNITTLGLFLMNYTKRLLQATISAKDNVIEVTQGLNYTEENIVGVLFDTSDGNGKRVSTVVKSVGVIYL